MKKSIIYKKSGVYSANKKITFQKYQENTKNTIISFKKSGFDLYG